MKKIGIGIWSVVLVCFLCLGANYISNEVWIDGYQSGDYKGSCLQILGFTEAYIAPYNEGNRQYQLENYEKAIEQYEKALTRHPSYHRECKIRINLVLAMLAGIEPEKITKENLQDTLNLLEDAKEVLYAHGCAEEEEEGHNADAQRLKDEIEQFEKKLQENVTADPDNSQEEQKEEEKEQDEEKRRRKLKNS